MSKNNILETMFTNEINNQIAINNKAFIEKIKNKKISVIGLNDSLGINLSLFNIKQNIVDIIEKKFKSNINFKSIDGFNLSLNKTEHIDYFLKNNLSKEDMTLTKICGVTHGLENFARTYNLPKSITKLDFIAKKLYKLNKEDKHILLVDTIKNADIPVIVYSSGSNNIMREIGANPISLKKDGKKNNENYLYSMNKIADLAIIDKVIEDIETNFKNILTINSDCQIYCLGLYTPKTISDDKMLSFINLINNFNLKLQILCYQYKITFIDTTHIGCKYTSNIDFHLNTKGHQKIADLIVNKIYRDSLRKKNKPTFANSFIVNNAGVVGLIEDLRELYDQSYNKIDSLDGYNKKRQISITEERGNEIKVLKKVLEMKQR